MTARLALDELLAGVAPAPQVLIAGLTLDSRSVAPGDAFVALKGGHGHGLDHASEAIARGARAVLWDPSEGREPGAAGAEIPFVTVRGLRERLGAIADRCYGAPSSRLTVAGVTGTNGRPPVPGCSPRRWIASRAAAPTSARSARDSRRRSKWLADDAGRHLVASPAAALADAGATHVAMEVSSHALDQRRVDGVRMRVAAFCNLTRDHLDYHGTMERYAEAKGRLFRLPGLEHAVINVGDPVGARFAAALAPGVELTAVAVGGEAPLAPRFVHVLRVTLPRAGSSSRFAATSAHAACARG